MHRNAKHPILCVFNLYVNILPLKEVCSSVLGYPFWVVSSLKILHQILFLLIYFYFTTPNKLQYEKVLNLMILYHMIQYQMIQYCIILHKFKEILYHLIHFLFILYNIILYGTIAYIMS